MMRHPIEVVLVAALLLILLIALVGCQGRGVSFVSPNCTCEVSVNVAKEKPKEKKP